jgi:serine/threonine protein kinase/tetratricopeptide (TPR) repeat protein
MTPIPSGSPPEIADAVTNLPPAAPDGATMAPVDAPPTPPPKRPPSGQMPVAESGKHAHTTTTGPLAPGQAFGSRYHIIRLLGIGGMGAVYQAWDGELGVAVAIKIVRPEVTADPITAADLERRFKRELLLAREVTHKNVVRIHDLGEIDGIKYITMPYIQGRDLASMLRTSGKLPVPLALRIARQVAAGLQAAHEAGVIHRDLKPANIMVDDDEHACIMDFGIARSAAGGGGTMLGAVIGTVDYMAPEQARGENVDRRADIYAFGLILYDLLGGRRTAGRSSSVVAELMARMQEAPAPLRAHDADIPEAIDRIIQRCLQPNADARYQSIAELLADLDRLDADGHPVAGTQLPRRSAVRRSIIPQRAPWWPWAAAVAIVVIGFGALVLRDRARSEGESPSAVAIDHPVTMAILPFRNASGDSSLDWLGTGFPELLRTELGESSVLRAVSSDRVHQILRDLRLSSDTSFDPGTLARLAEFSSAETLVWGQYVRFGPEIRIDATLENVKEGRRIALAAAAPSETELLAAVSNMANAIRGAVTSSPDVLKTLQANAFQPSTRSVQALRDYTQGLALTRDGKHVEALKRFEAAVEADRGFALAYSRQAQTLDRLNRSDEAESASAKALELAGQLPAREKYLIEAAHARIVGDNRNAVAAYTNLAKASPDDSEVAFALAQLHESTGDYDRAHDLLSKVLERDPKYLDALILMGRVEIRRTKWQDALERLNPALSLAIQFDNDEAKAEALHAIGVVYRRLSKPDEGLRHFRQALEIKERVGEKGSIAATVSEIGHAQVQLGTPADAISSYTTALKLRRELNDRRGIAASLVDIGGVYGNLGRYDDALAFYKESLQIQRELGNAAAEAAALNNIGNIHNYLGQHHDAVTNLRLSLELREKVNDLPGTAITLHNLGESYAKLGQFDDSLAHYLRSLDAWRKANEQRSAAMELHYMATVFEYQGRHGAAVNAREEALKTLRDLNDQSVFVPGVLSGYGRALNQIGRFDEATKQLEEAITLARQLKHQALVARISNYQGEGALYRGDLKAARLLFEEALPIAQMIKNSELTLLSKVNLGKVAIEEQKPAQAVAVLRGLASEAEAGGHRYLAAETTVLLGEALLARRQTSQALSDLKSALARAEKMGMQPLAARAHAALARALRTSGGPTAVADRHASEARRMIDAMRKEATSGDPFKRADLAALYQQVSPSGR